MATTNQQGGQKAGPWGICHFQQPDSGRLGKPEDDRCLKTVGKSEVRGGRQFFAQGVQRNRSPLLSASQETGVRRPLLRGKKITRRKSATRQVKLEAGASSREGPSAEAPAAGLATEFAPTPWQGRWGGAGKHPGRNSLWFPWPGAAEALWGLLKAMCPRPKYLDGDPDRTAGCHPRVCVGGGRSRRTREAVASRSLGPRICRAAFRHQQVPNSERAPVFVNKPVTWPQQHAPRP